MNLTRDQLLAQLARQEKQLAEFERQRAAARERLEATRDLLSRRPPDGTESTVLGVTSESSVPSKLSSGTSRPLLSTRRPAARGASWVVPFRTRRPPSWRVMGSPGFGVRTRRPPFAAARGASGSGLGVFGAATHAVRRAKYSDGLTAFLAYLLDREDCHGGRARASFRTGIVTA